MTVPGVIALALLPKCPACLMAYGGVFAAADVSRFVVGPLVGVLAVLSIALLLWYSVRRGNAVLGVTGVLAVIAIYGIGRELGLPWGRWLGVALLSGGYLHECLRSVLHHRSVAAVGER